MNLTFFSHWNSFCFEIVAQLLESRFCLLMYQVPLPGCCYLLNLPSLNQAICKMASNTINMQKLTFFCTMVQLARTIPLFYNSKVELLGGRDRKRLLRTRMVGNMVQSVLLGHKVTDSLVPHTFAQKLNGNYSQIIIHRIIWIINNNAKSYSLKYAILDGNHHNCKK